MNQNQGKVISVLSSYDGTIRIRDFEPGDTEGCLKLLQLGHTPEFTRERFEWLHFQNPMAPSRIVVAEYKGQIVGLYSAIKKQVTIFGKTYIGARDVDPVVHPSFRKKGIFTAMLDYALEHYREIDFHFNFANASSRAGFLKMGWREIGSLSDCLYQVHYDRVPSKAFLLYALSHLRRIERQHTAQELDSVDKQEFANLYAEKRAGICVNRTYEYVNWRYSENPLYKYYQIADGTGPGISKLAIGKPDRLRGTFTLHDFFVAQGSADCSMDYLVNYVRDNSFDVLRTWRTCSSALRSQMIYNPRSRHSALRFFVRKCSQHTPSALYDMDKWMLTPGDLEVM